MRSLRSLDSHHYRMRTETQETVGSMKTPSEIALSLIENAGFRDSRVIPVRVVQQMLEKVIADSHQKQQRMFDLLEKIPCHEPWPWDRMGTLERTR